MIYLKHVPGGDGLHRVGSAVVLHRRGWQHARVHATRLLGCAAAVCVFVGLLQPSVALWRPEDTPCAKNRCGECIATPGCGWCGETFTCMEGDEDGPVGPMVNHTYRLPAVPCRSKWVAYPEQPCDPKCTFEAGTEVEFLDQPPPIPLEYDTLCVNGGQRSWAHRDNDDFFGSSFCDCPDGFGGYECSQCQTHDVCPGLLPDGSDGSCVKQILPFSEEDTLDMVEYSCACAGPTSSFCDFYSALDGGARLTMRFDRRGNASFDFRVPTLWEAPQRLRSGIIFAGELTDCVLTESVRCPDDEAFDFDRGATCFRTVCKNDRLYSPGPEPDPCELHPTISWRWQWCIDGIEDMGFGDLDYYCQYPDGYDDVEAIGANPDFDFKCAFTTEVLGPFAFRCTTGQCGATSGVGGTPDLDIDQDSEDLGEAALIATTMGVPLLAGAVCSVWVCSALRRRRKESLGAVLTAAQEDAGIETAPSKRLVRISGAFAVPRHGSAGYYAADGAAAASAELPDVDDAASVAEPSDGTFTKKPDPGPELSVRNIQLDVKVGERGRRRLRNVLRDVSFRLPPGLMGLLGPSGAGKTSLLDIIAGRKSEPSPNGPVVSCSGTVSIDGDPMSPSDRRAIVGYIMQEDVLLSTHTVREYLLFQARLRLAPKMHHSPHGFGRLTHHRSEASTGGNGAAAAASTEATRTAGTTVSVAPAGTATEGDAPAAADEELDEDDVLRRVDTLIDAMGLSHVAGTPIGGEFVRGLSGGEKRRVSISVELITAPTILVADEPTSGLDSAIALTVVEDLWDVSRTGKPVLLSIHQPSSQIWKLLDSVCFLSAFGHLLYTGPRDKAVDFFVECGYSAPDEGVNPADHLMALTSAQSVEQAEKMADAFAEKQRITLAASSNLADHVVDDVFASSPAVEPETEELQKERVRRYHRSTADWWTQFTELSMRTAMNSVRNPMLLYLNYGAVLVAGLVAGVVYQGLELDFYGLQDRLGFFLFSFLLFSVTSLSSIGVWREERLLFLRERASNTYSTGPYFWAKVLWDLVPLRIGPPFIYSCIVYYFIGLKPEAIHLFTFIVAIVMVNAISSALCMAVGAAVASTSLANLIASFALLFTTLLCGLMSHNRSEEDIMLFVLQRLSYMNYAFEMLANNEIVGRTFSLAPKLPGEVAPPTFPATGETVLLTFGMVVGNTEVDVIALFLMLALYLSLVYCILSSCVKERR